MFDSKTFLYVCGPLVVVVSQKSPMYLGSEAVCGQDVFVLGSWCAPGVVKFEALVTEVGPAVSAAFGGLQSLRRFTELTHDCHAAKTHCVPVPTHMEKDRHQSSIVH